MYGWLYAGDLGVSRDRIARDVSAGFASRSCFAGLSVVHAMVRHQQLQLCFESLAFALLSPLQCAFVLSISRWTLSKTPSGSSGRIAQNAFLRCRSSAYIGETCESGSLTCAGKVDFSCRTRPACRKNRRVWSTPRFTKWLQCRVKRACYGRDLYKATRSALASMPLESLRSYCKDMTALRSAVEVWSTVLFILCIHWSCPC